MTLEGDQDKGVDASVCDTGGLGMMSFIVWILLTVDEPLRDDGMSQDERDYITASLMSQSHQPFNLLQVSALAV